MTTWQEERELLEALQRGEESAYKLAYEKYFPMICKLVLENQGTKQDAQDLFQDVMETLLIQAVDESFELISSLSTYLFSIGKNKWLNQLRRKGPESRYNNIAAERELQKFHNPIQDEIDASHRNTLVERHMSALDPTCKMLFKLMQQNLTLAEIANEMNTTEGYVKKLKHKCKEKLRKGIQEDPDHKTSA
jgi:RNA polymerase sigma factor (sigma-70 family)